MDDEDDWSARVRRGYDLVSFAYRSDDGVDVRYREWVDRLHGKLQPGSRIVDLGCGCGVPVARWLSEFGHAVTGVDFSEVQIERARRLVPGAAFVRKDLRRVQFDPERFDAAVMLYSIIHVPVAEHRSLLERVCTWLRPGGVLLLTAGVDEWTGAEDDWFGTAATMWWSQADAASYRRWLTGGGFVIDDEAVVPDGESAHTLFWAHRP